jgi:hypothetical protein
MEKNFFDRSLHSALWLNFASLGYALISTSTPEGKSSLDNASTVLEEEV